jgi:hypothetical protein
LARDLSDRIGVGPVKHISGDRMSAPRVVIQADRKALNPIAITAPQTAWRWLGWLGLALAVVGGVDIALRWYPLVFKSTEWEFGTISITFASLPLFSIGLVALLASFLARGVRSGISVMAVVFSLLSLFVAVTFVLFLLDVPLAIKMVRGPVGLELKKTIVRTLIMGATFEMMYVAGAVVSFRYLLRRVKDV